MCCTFSRRNNGPSLLSFVYTDCQTNRRGPDFKTNEIRLTKELKESQRGGSHGGREVRHGPTRSDPTRGVLGRRVDPDKNR